MGERIPIILDTDIGSDIDDAIALSYLLKQPRCELVGITTVTGDVAKRCAIADVLCRAVGREDVPIRAGASNVLLTGPGQPNVPHYAAIEHLPHRSDWTKNTAVDFLRESIRARPGEITLLTIGPFTNIATLFAVDPEIPSLLKGFVSMAGIYFGSDPPREWNCLVDPIATAMVYRVSVPDHVSFGLDVTKQCTMPAEEVRRRFDRPPLSSVIPMAEVWFEQRPTITFHDPLAAVCIFRPEICSTIAE
ncbi:MAG TPA: nucleoside hydrolase [Tepidisphaeraceae bacterium]|nr:nucleoside hydrolase [Tepidisphaeraceae bacterium]